MKKTKRIIRVLLLLVLLCSCNNEKKIEMTKLTNEQFELFSQKFYSVNKLGSTYNLEEIKKKDICHKQDEICEQYFLMQMFYQKGLEAYLDQKLDLYAIESEIENHPKHTIAPSEDRQKYIFQMKSETNLKYIFLMNNIYVERLTDEEYDVFKEKYEQEKINDEFINLIENTFATVINYNGDSNVSTTYTNVAPFVEGYKLALYLAWTPLPFERDDDGNYIYFEENQLIIEYMVKISKEKGAEYSEKLGYPVEIVTKYGNSE